MFPSPSKARRGARAIQRGVVMIEVLVALLIFMLGVLGLIGLQGSMTRVQTEAKFRTDAAYLANEAIGRLWSDTTNLSSYSGDSCAALARCKEWQDKVSNSLPNGAGTITVQLPSGDVSIVINWTMPGLDQGGEHKDGDKHTYATSTSVVKAGS